MANDKKDNSIAAGVAGAVIGGGVAVAATKILSNPKNRQAIMDKVSDMRDTVRDSVENTKSRTKELQKKLHNKLDKEKNEFIKFHKG